MNNNKAKIRINFSNREIEFEGTEKFIKDSLDKFKDLIESFKIIPSGKPKKGGKVIPSEELVSIEGKLPKEFGEYLHEFPSDISDQDKFFLAAHFVQSSDENSSYTAKAAEKMLEDNGIKIKAPGTMTKRLKDKKRIFPVTSLGKGVYRISKQGTTHITELKKSTD